MAFEENRPSCYFFIRFYSVYSPLWEMVQEGIDLKSIQWSQH